MTEGIVTPIASSPSSTARGSGGRAIGYGEFGDPNGKPVILFHGFGDSRLTRYPDDELTARLGIRLITFDRPGIGLTDPMKELTILDRTDDVIDLANQLGLHDVYLLGWSGGAPYALAAAGCMAGTVKRATIVSGFGPFERPGFKRLAPREIKRVMTILKVAPWMANVMATESQKSLEGNASGAMEASRGLGGSADAGVLNMSGVRANVTAGAEEAFRQGPAGVANDMLLLFRFKWGFNPEDVHTPVDLWYGDDDQMTPPDVGRGLASILPQPRLRMVPGAGHLLYLRNWEEILRTLVADDAPATTTTFQAIAPVAALSPVTETLAANSLSETTSVSETEHAEEAKPVAARDDVLGTAPVWSWTQPAAASEAPAETPADQRVERQPVAYQAEPVAPVDKPVVTPRPRVTPAGGDQLARLRALGFIVDVPEPEAAPEPEAVEAAEPAVVAAQAEPAAFEAENAAEPMAEAAGVPEAAAEAVETEPEAEPARPELRLVEPQAPPKRPSLSWQPNRVTGLIIGKPRRVAPVEPVAPAPEAAPEPAEAEAVAVATPAEPEPEAAAPEAVEAEGEAAIAEEAAAVAEPEAAAAEPDEVAAEPEAAVEPKAVAPERETATVTEAVAEQAAEASTADTEAAVAEPDATLFVREAEPPAEPETAVKPSKVRRAGRARESAEARRLRAAGFFVQGPDGVVEESAAEAQAPSEVDPERRVSLDDAELERLRAAGFAPAQERTEAISAEAGHDAEIAAVDTRPVEPEPVEAEELEPEGVAAEAVGPEAAEPEPVAVETDPVVAESEAVAPEAVTIVAESEAVAPDAETGVADVVPVTVEAVVAEVEAAPTAGEQAAEAEREPEPDPVAAEPESGPIAAEQEPESVAAEPASEPVATELEEEASEAVVYPGRESEAGESLGGTRFGTPHSEPTPAIAASAGDAPVMKSAMRTPPADQLAGQQIVETGVGWVESVPMNAAPVAAASREAEPDSPPEPMPAEAEPAAAVRDETLERLRAAGFLIGEPRRR